MLALQEELSIENYGNSCLSYVLGIQAKPNPKVELESYYRDITGKLVRGSVSNDPLGINEAKNFWKQF